MARDWFRALVTVILSALTLGIATARGQSRSVAEFAGSLDGQISNSNAEPIAGAEVMLLRRQYVQGETRFLRVDRATTDKAGLYHLRARTPGRHFLAARSPQSGSAAGGCSYFFDSVEPQGATPVDIAAGDSLSGISLRIPDQKAASLTGAVLGEDGAPVPNALVTAIAHHGIVGVQGSNVHADGNGVFTLDNVCPGDYTVQAIVSNGSQVPRSGFKKLSMQGADVRDTSIVISSPASLSGRILVDGHSSSSGSLVRFKVLTLYTDTERFDPVSVAEVHDDGTFLVRGAPGLAVVRVVGLPPEWALKGVRMNGMDVTDAGFELGTAAGADALEVELTSHPSVLSGTVTSNDVAPVEECSVVVFSQDPGRWTFLSTYVSVVPCDRERRFRITGLPKGDYQATAVRSKPLGDFVDPDFLDAARSNATKVSLRDGEAKAVELKIVTPPRR